MPTRVRAPTAGASNRAAVALNATADAANKRKPPPPLGAAKADAGQKDDAGATQPPPLDGRARVRKTPQQRDDAAMLKSVGEKFYRFGSSLGRLRETFRKLDTDGSGELSYDEIRTGLDVFNFGLNERQFLLLMKRIDPDGDGSVTYDEFITYFDDYTPLEGEHIKGAPQASDAVKENVRTGAPWEAIKSEWKSFDAPLAGAEKETEQYEPGSLEQAFADRRAAQIISDKLRQSDSNIRQAFRKADGDRSGTIDKDEFLQCMRRMNMGIPATQLSRIFDAVDADGSGSIDYEEFVNEFNGDNTVVGRRSHASNKPSKTERGPPQAPGTPASRTPSRDGEVARINRDSAVGVGSGDVTRDVAFLREKLRQRSKNVAAVFRKYDANGDGHLSAAELHRGFQDMGMDVGLPSVNAILSAANQSGEAKEIHFKDFCNFVIERGGVALDNRSGAASAPLWLDDPAGEGMGGGVDRRRLFGASPIPVGGHALRPSSRDSVLSSNSRSTTAMLRSGRHSSTPYDYDTRHVVQPTVPEHAVCPLSIGRTFKDCMADSNASVRAWARSNREAVLQQKHAMKNAYERARVEADEKKARALDEARLASRELQTQRYLERMRLYEVAGSGGGVSRPAQRAILDNQFAHMQGG